MSNYVKSTNFASKDSLPLGDPAKIVKGTEIDTEFNNISTAVASKVDSLNAALTGTPTAPTASPGTNTTQIATTAFVAASVSASQSNANITGGSITGITDLAVADGGTGLSDGSNLAQPGDIKFTARNSPPTGWLKANGAAVSRTTYAALFAAIGTIYGAGDGSTTFNLPDLRGEFIRGWDDGRGVDSGRALGSAQTDAFQGHWHQGYTLNQGTSALGGFGRILSGSGGNTVLEANMVQFPISDGTNGTPRTSSETRPRNVALMAVIKF